MFGLPLSRNIGIDLGTSRTRVYVPYKGVVYDEPSTIAFDLSDNSLICSGDCANEMLGRAPKNVSVHQIIHHGAIQDESIAEIYIKEALKKSKKLFNFLKSDILINTSTNSTSMEQRAIVQTCKRAGAKNVYIEQSAILATIGTGISKNELYGRMIADIGAGTTEAAVISLGGMSGSRTLKMGGNDMDKKIVDFLKNRYSFLISLDIAKKVKEKIGSVELLDNPKEIKVKGSDLNSKLPKIVTITSNDIAEALEDSVSLIIDTISKVFQSTPPELTADIIERGVILTGGVAKLKGIDTVVRKHINSPVFVADKPEYAVINGIGNSIKTGHLDFHKSVLLSK